eukprot:XP_001701228.1 cell wall protein pherophorin-C12 [Chlamydomonas reinhardtii]
MCSFSSRRGRPMARLLLLVTLAVALVVQQAAAQGNSKGVNRNPLFPDCKCERDRRSSPYRASLTSTEDYPGGRRYCFTFDVVSCQVDNPCCYMNLYKIEFPFTYDCRGSLQYIEYQGGNRSIIWGPSYLNADIPRLATIPAGGTYEITDAQCDDYQATIADAANEAANTYGAMMTKPFQPDINLCYPDEVSICFTLTLAAPPGGTYTFSDNECTDLQSFMADLVNTEAGDLGAQLLTPFAPDLNNCQPDFVQVCGTFFSDAEGAKLQPWVDTNEPFELWHNTLLQGGCFNVPYLIGYSFAYEVLTPDGSPDGCIYCFSLGLTACLRASPCCLQDLTKIEFDVVPACVGSMVYSIQDGEQRPAQYQLAPYPALKMNRLSKQYIDVPGTVVCVVLKPPCATLTDLRVDE